MIGFLRNSNLGEQLTIAAVALFIVLAVAGTTILTVAAMNSVGDSEPVGNETDAQISTDIAWLEATTNGGSTTTEITAYNETGTIIWQTEVTNSNLSSGLTGASVVGTSEYVYVASNKEIYTLNASTGNLTNRTDNYVTQLALDPSDNLLTSVSHESQSLSKDTIYSIDKNATITVDNASYDGTGNISTTTDKTISVSSYESDTINTLNGNENDILAATDEYVVVSVYTNRTDDPYDMHIVDRSTGDSVYEIQYTHPSYVQRAVVKPNGTIVLNAQIKPESSAQGDINETFVEFDTDTGTVVTEVTKNSQNLTHDFFRNGWIANLTFTSLGEFDVTINKATVYEYNHSYQISIYDQSGAKIYQNDSAEFGHNYIDAYGGTYDIKVDGLGLREQRVNDTTIYHARTNTEKFSMEYVGTGYLNITSVKDKNSTELENLSVQINDSAGESVYSASNTTAPVETELTAGESYTVTISKPGYFTESKSISISENNTTQISFRLSEKTDSTNTTNDSDGGSTIIGGGGSSDGLSSNMNIILYGIGGGSSFLFLLLLALYSARKARQGF
ncbi:PEGA domain-containing protein [Halolamina salifodinae]|uniref:PEGA domain-containing protein n=1 Tax=Halolamina salifodinae TaxID=1202767 RepID=A0A8T4GWZ4_9EURY|nr:PEGA domain-containing protein [Halolamina salifodinae]MBP1986980.1 hypothetical protein [Halolamina salifodinae]